MTDTQKFDFARWLPDIVAVKTHDACAPALWLLKQARIVYPSEYLWLCHLAEATLSLPMQNAFDDALIKACADHKGRTRAFDIDHASFDKRHAALKEVLG